MKVQVVKPFLDFPIDPIFQMKDMGFILNGLIKYLETGCMGAKLCPGNTKGGSLFVPLTSCLTSLD